MSEKIISLRTNSLGWKTLLHQTLEKDDVEAVILTVRINGCWSSAWCNQSLGGLAMGTMKLFRDVSDFLEEE